MKNVWKGMTVGAFAGAVVGVAMDIATGTGRRAAEMSAKAAEGVSTRARSGASQVAGFVEEKMDEWDVTDKVDRARDEVEQVVDKAKDTLKRS